MTSIRFTGDWGIWLGVAAALIAGVATWALYRRETRGRGDVYGHVLPVLRAAAVVLLVLMLTGPVLSHRKVLGQLARLLVFMDDSASMRLTDVSLSEGRKLALAAELGFLGEDLLPEHILAGRRELAAAATAARNGAMEYDSETAVRVRDALAKSLAHIEKTRLDSDMIAPAKKGTIGYQFWANAGISKLDDVEKVKGFPEKPSGAVEVDQFLGRRDWSDNYLSKMAGYIYPPTTGKYTFWITADDMARLYLSEDEGEAGKKLIARVDSWAPLDQWQQKSSQKSRPIMLEAGRRYYIEAVHIEQSGGDHVAVGWELPDGTKERPIGGDRLSPYKSGGGGGIYAGSRDSMLKQFRDDLLAPAEKLTKDGQDNPRASAQRLAELSAAVEPWQEMLDRAFERWAQGLVRSGVDEVASAIERIDAMSRRERIEALLLGGEEPVLEQLANEHNVAMVAFGAREITPLWHSRAGAVDSAVPFPETLETAEPADSTNISLSLLTAIGMGQKAREQVREGELTDRMAAVILSDGRHNFGLSPLHQAKVCGSSGIPVYTVGLGCLRGGSDLAVMAVDAPESVFFKDRIKGRVALKDNMPTGKAFKLRVEGYGRVLWEEELTSSGAGRRLIEFDFGIEELVQDQLAGKDSRLQFQSQPMQLQVSVAGLEQIDIEPGNDRSQFRCQAVLRRNRVMILDGRPRWEFRYIRNLFERDDKWEVSAVSADPTTRDGGIKRGDTPGRFPATRENLFSYDLIIVGDLPSEMLKEEEMEWIREAVSRKGCGIIFIDGLRKHMHEYGQTPLAELVPVSWTDEQVIRNPQSLRLTDQGVLRLTDRGVDTAALTLSAGVKTNSEVWASLKPPHWLASVEPLPGGEVLVEARLKDEETPAIVYRRVGAGKVLYMAFDETWRWRYRVADEYHQKYWNQIGRLIMAPPFAVADRFVSIDCGALVYTPGRNAEIRARIRDTEGRSVTEAQAVAHIYRDGAKIASVDLELDENDGTYRAQSGALQAGEHEVKIEVVGYPPEQMIAVGRFFVEAPESGELTELTCDEQLLRQIAETSGGHFVWEHELSGLLDELRPLSSGRVVETETVLWQSYLWFAIVVMLLTIEWVLRKRAGML